jgi:hypothetical protein
MNLVSRLPQVLNNWARPVALISGGGIITLALVTYIWNLDLGNVFNWFEQAFGPVFIVLYLGLVGLGLTAFFQISKDKDNEVWFEVGEQASSGISTLALTFTLLGISLGIESLSSQSLTPETIGSVIQELTRHFSTAFMTTVVGLPTAHCLRSALSIRWVSNQNR